MLTSKNQGEMKKSSEMYGSLVTRDWKTEVPQSSVSRGDGVQTRTKNGQRQGGRGIVKIEAKYTDRPYLLSAGVPMVAQTPQVQNPFQMPVVPLKAPSRSLHNGKLPDIKIECQEQRSSSYFPLPSIFNQMGQPVFQKNRRSLRRKQKRKNQDLIILEKILYQPLHFVKSNTTSAPAQLDIPPKPQIAPPPEYWGQQYGGDFRDLDCQNQQHNGHPEQDVLAAQEENRNSQPPDSLIGIRKSSQILSEGGSKSSFSSKGSNFELIRLGGQSEEVVKYKIDLTYSETSRKFRQQMAIVGHRGMTFQEFIQSLKNLANFAHSSEFTLYVEKEQDLVPLLSMDQLARKKTNFLRIKSGAESSQLSDDVLAKKLNKKRKNREVIMITKLSNKEQEEELED